MTFLLDVNTLIAAIWEDHADHATVNQWLGDFIQKHDCEFIPDDFSPQKTSARTSKQLTDSYLAELAQRHQMKLATFDKRISHPAVEIIS